MSNVFQFKCYFLIGYLPKANIVLKEMLMNAKNINQVSNNFGFI